jgi:DNA repair exonuclease SbcCD nuclease subunit
MNILFRTDVHASDHAPSSWKGDYLGEICNSLQQINRLAHQVGAAAILDGGDFFHVKAATRNSHALVQQMIRLHSGLGCPVYAIEGNHDLAYNNVDTVERQPIGVMFASGSFERLRDVVLEEGGLRVRIVGVPYSSNVKLEDLRAIRKQPGDDKLIVVAHCLATENPSATAEELFGEPVFRYSDLISDDGPDCWCFGHWHKDQGITTVNGVLFVNTGSVSRGALTHENLTRIPHVVSISVTPGHLEPTIHDLDVLPAADVFDLAAKTRAEEERGAIDEFVAKLQLSAQQDSEQAIESTLNALDFAKDVRESALNYLERARTEVG